MADFTNEKVLGYYEKGNVVRPVFEALTLAEFKEKFPGKAPLLGRELAEDDDYLQADSEDIELTI